MSQPETIAGGSALDPTLISFGVNALTNDYLAPDLKEGRVIEVAFDAAPRQKVEHSSLRAAGISRDAFDGIDKKVLSSAGWGVIFAEDEADDVKRAMQDLIKHRECPPERVYTYQAGESAQDWIARNTIANEGDPATLPYYLCLVGSPGRVPFSFQYGLDVTYGVGRLDFDSPDDYAQYIANVIAYEKEQNRPLNRLHAALMGATNPGDRATQLSSQYLIPGVARDLAKANISTAIYLGEQGGPIPSTPRGEMTKANLAAVMAGHEDTLPALLFIASHGWAFPGPDNRQSVGQGALVCQQWQSGVTAASSEWLFMARDVPSDVALQGVVVFCSVCFGAGTPKFSAYQPLWANTSVTGQTSTAVAEGDFVAALPKKLLSRPNGPLGFLGHIDQTWATGFLQDQGGSLYSAINPFAKAARAVLRGYPLGYALDTFNSLSTQYGTEVLQALQARQANQHVDESTFATSWQKTNDARGFILLGDPGVAVRAYELVGA